MLVLCRKKEEIIVIEFADGTTLGFAVIDIDRNKVRIGIEATPDVKIYRKEVYDAFCAERKRAADTAANQGRWEGDK